MVKMIVVMKGNQKMHITKPQRIRFWMRMAELAARDPMGEPAVRIVKVVE